MKTSQLISTAGDGLRYVSWGRLVMVFGMIVAVWILDVSGWGSPIDNWAYDICLSWKPRVQNDPDRVLIVETPGASEPPVSLPDLVVKLRALGATRVGICIEEADVNGLDTANIILCRAVRRDPENPARWRFSNEKDQSGRHHNWGCIAVPFSERGICREHQLSIDVDGRSFPSFEAALTDYPVPDESERGSTQLLRISFRGGVGSLPRVTALQVLEDELVPQLVRDRCVLVGSPADGLSEFHTPTATDGLGMSLLELQAHVVNTMLCDSAVHTTSSTGTFLLLMFTGLLSAAIYHRSSVRTAFVVMLLTVTGGAVLAVVALAWLSLWMPVMAITLLQISCLALILERKTSYARSALNGLLLEISGRVWKRRWSEDFFAEENPWPQVISFIRQTLGLERLMILELPAHRHHLRQVSAANCSVADLLEPRRDIRRNPYADALSALKPLRIDLDSRPFLKRLPYPEEQYLAPLISSGRVLGFLAVSAATEHITDRHMFESRLRDFAEQAAELLNRCQRAQSERQRRNGLARLIQSHPESSVYGEVVHATNLLESRLSRLEHIFQQSTTAAMIFDLFGRPTMVNERMKKILGREQLNGDASTTVDLLAHLTKVSLDEARAILARVIVDKRVESLPVRLHQQKSSYVLNVRPLEIARSRHREFRDEASPFETHGILCELVDHTSLVDVYRLKNQLSEALANIVRNDLVAVDSAATLMSENHESESERAGYESLIHHQIAETADRLRICQQGLNFDEDEESNVCHPVDVIIVLNEALERMQDCIDENQIKVQIRKPEFTSLVFAVPLRLQDAFVAVLDFACRDAIRGTEIVATVEERMGSVVISFSNRGVGVQILSLQAALEGHTTDEAYEPLRQAASQLSEWGGNIVGTGIVGEGVQLRIHLRAFQ